MTQRDENPAGVHLPLDPLPGHSSRGRLERVLRRGEFAVTAELNPPDSADPQDVYDRVAPFEGWVDAINAVDASGANCHMSSRRHLRAADPHGLRAGAAGRLPRPQPHRHPGRRAGRRGDGRRQRPLPDRRRRAGRRPAGRPSGLRPRFDLAARNRAHHARRGALPLRPKDHLAAAPLHRRRRQSLRAALRLPAAAARQEGRRPARSSCRRSTASTCRCSASFMQRVRDLGLHEKCFILAGVGPLASARAAQLDPRQRARHPHPRRHHRAARRRGEPEARGQDASASRSCRRCREIAGVSGVHVMAYRQEELVAEIVHESGVLAGRRPWRREAAPGRRARRRAAAGRSSPSRRTCGRQRRGAAAHADEPAVLSLERHDITI